MKRMPLRKVGKIGEANIEARKIIAEIAEEKGLNYCELQVVDNCLRRRYLAPAHRHKRAWYKGDVALLSAYEQWVSSCVVCHDRIENDKELTEEMFLMLRGRE